MRLGRCGLGWAGTARDGEGQRGLGWSVAATLMSEAGVIWEMRVREKEIESDGVGWDGRDGVARLRRRRRGVGWQIRP